MADVFPKICSCGRSYTEATWALLPSLGMNATGREGPGEFLELRRCLCGTTLALDLGTPTPESLAQIITARPKPPRR